MDLSVEFSRMDHPGGEMTKTLPLRVINPVLSTVLRRYLMKNNGLEGDVQGWPASAEIVF